MDNWNLIKLNEAADMLSVKPQTLRNWIFKGTCPLPYYKINERTIRFKKTEVESFLEEIRYGK